MDNLQRHLGEGVARVRPELSANDQQALIDQVVGIIESYKANAHRGPVTMVAVEERRDAAARPRRAEDNGIQLEPARLAFVVACQPDGTITEVIQDVLGLGSRLAPAADLRAIASPFHLRKATRFLRGIQSNHATYDCALSFMGRSGIVRLFCSGFSVGSQVVVIATEEPLAVSVPQELSRLAEKKFAKLGPVLKELASWKKNQKSAPPPALDDQSHSSEPGGSPEAVWEQSTSSGRRRLLEVAAHDLRNPISGILAACQYLMEDASQALEPHQILILCSIESSTRLALQLVQDLAEIPAIRLNPPQLDFRPTDLVAIAHQAVCAVRTLAETMKVKVQVRVRDQIPAIRADGVRLGEALYGMLVSAIGSTPAAGQVEMMVGVRTGEVTLTLHREYTAAAGRPSGASSPRGSRRKLSDIHTALLSARTRRIVEAHGGTMRVEVRGKHECSWAVTLPVAASHAVRKK